MKLSLTLVTVLATFAVALPQNKAGQGNQAAKGGQGQAKAQGNNGAAAAGAAAASDVNAKANNGADVSLASFLTPITRIAF